MVNLASRLILPVLVTVFAVSQLVTPGNIQAKEPPKVILGEASPNPFGSNRPDTSFTDNSFTTIPYTVTGSDSADVVIIVDNKIISMQRETEYFVDTLVNERKTPGDYSVEFHPSASLKRGIYVVAAKDVYQNILGKALRLTYLGNKRK